MADIILAKPEAGTRSVVQSVENARIQLNFMTGDALLERSGDDLVFSFEDGSSIVIQDFYQRERARLHSGWGADSRGGFFCGPES